MDGNGHRPEATIVLGEPPMNGWGLRAPLEALGHEVVGHAEDGEGAVELAARLKPDLVVLDVQLGGFGGIGAAERLRPDGHAGFVFVASRWDPATLDARKRAMRAKGILMRRLGIDEGAAHLMLQRRARNTRRPLAMAIDEVV